MDIYGGEIRILYGSRLSEDIAAWRASKGDVVIYDEDYDPEKECRQSAQCWIYVHGEHFDRLLGASLQESEISGNKILIYEGPTRDAIEFVREVLGVDKTVAFDTDDEKIYLGYVLSASPLGLRMPHSMKRLMEISKEQRETDGEWIMAQMWAEENARQPMSLNRVPLDFLLHRCTDECGKKSATDVLSLIPDNHKYEPLKDEEVSTMATAIQWFGTNIGRSFLERYLEAFRAAHDKARRKRMATFDGKAA